MTDELAFPGTDDGRTVAEFDARIKAHNDQVPAPAGHIDQTAVQWIQSHQGGYASASIYPNEVNGTVPFWLEAPAAPVAPAIRRALELARYACAALNDKEALAAIDAALSAPAAPVERADLLMRASLALEVSGNEWRKTDPSLRVELAAALAAPVARILQVGDHTTPANRLATMLTEALGADHPALADLAALVLTAAPATPVAQPLTSRGFLLHWPKPGGGRQLVWSDSDAAGVSIGCPVEPVFSRGVRASGTDQEGGV